MQGRGSSQRGGSQIKLSGAQLHVVAPFSLRVIVMRGRRQQLADIAGPGGVEDGLAFQEAAPRVGRIAGGVDLSAQPEGRRQPAETMSKEGGTAGRGSR
jgi:hypothetical protein